MEAQRYPEDFDGYVIGAPVLNLSGLQMKAIWNWIAVGPGPGEIKPEKFPTLADAVYDKCDALDGLKDGLIENPLKCSFDPAKDLKKCAAGQDDPSCFTGAQIAALKKVYEGPRNSAGKQLFPGFVPGGEVLASSGRGGAPPKSGWDGNLSGSFNLGDTFMKFMAFDPAPGANWDYRTYDFDKDPARMTAVSQIINATIPDLTAVKMRGGKIVHYHGWADPGVTRADVGGVLRSRDEDHGRERDQGLLPLLPGSGHVPLRRRPGLRQRGLAHRRWSTGWRRASRPT